MDSTAFYNILIFLLAAVIIVPLFRQLRSSPVLGYLAAGLLIGPFGLRLIEDSHSIHVLAEFGVVFLLFKIGLELSLERLKVLRRYVFGLGVMQVASCGLIIGLIAYFLGVSPGAAIIIGGGFALSSTAFVLQLLAERKEQTTRFGLIAFAILLLQDIAVVPLLALVPLLGEQTSSLTSALLTAGGKTILALASIIIFGQLLLRPFYRIIAGTKSPELFVATTLLVVLGTSWIMQYFGLSMALGAFLAGVLLAETEYRHQVEADIRPFKGILMGLFFMAVGMSIDFVALQNEWDTILILVTSLMLGKAFVITLLCKLYGLSSRVSVRVGVLLSQGGEFGFVLFGTAMMTGLISVSLGQTLLAVITISMALTPLMVFVGQKITTYLTKREKTNLATIEHNQHELNEHVIICGFGRIGQSIAKVLSAAGMEYIALDLDHARVTKCRGKQMPVFYGDSSRLEVLNAAGASQAKAAVITLTQPSTANHVVKVLHDNFPELEIYVRSQDYRHSLQLEDRGATAVVLEAGEASLQLGTIVLDALGTGSDEVNQIVNEFRENDYEKFEDLILGYDDEG